MTNKAESATNLPEDPAQSTLDRRQFITGVGAMVFGGAGLKASEALFPDTDTRNRRYLSGAGRSYPPTEPAFSADDISAPLVLGLKGGGILGIVGGGYLLADLVITKVKSSSETTPKEVTTASFDEFYAAIPKDQKVEITAYPLSYQSLRDGKTFTVLRGIMKATNAKGHTINYNQKFAELRPGIKPSINHILDRDYLKTLITLLAQLNRHKENPNIMFKLKTDAKTFSNEDIEDLLGKAKSRHITPFEESEIVSLTK